MSVTHPRVVKLRYLTIDLKRRYHPLDRIHACARACGGVCVGVGFKRLTHH
jgi:hypothetical protein